MSKIPGNLGGYHLVKKRHGVLGRWLLIIIIILIILWFTKRELVLEWMDYILNLIGK